MLKNNNSRWHIPLNIKKETIYQVRADYLLQFPQPKAKIPNQAYVRSLPINTAEILS